VHRHQKDQEISGGATVEAEQQHVALSSLIRHRAEPLGPLRTIAYFRNRFVARNLPKQVCGSAQSGLKLIARS
jgi:hypothetical protein